MSRRPLYIFAGGGTGGHIMPGLAIIERLRDRDPECEALFLCSEKPLDATILGSAGIDSVPLPARPAAVRPFPAAPLAFWRGWRKSVRISLITLEPRCGSGRPVVVVALGGYCAAPAVQAARRLDLPVLLVNLDVEPGKANRWIARRATEIVSAVPCRGQRGFEDVIGMPIRRGALAAQSKEICRDSLGLARTTPTLLVTGASQGAGSLNEFMTRFVAWRPEALNGWQILHLSGPERDEPIRRAYSHAGFDRVVVRAFCDPMAPAWGAADLALSRAGASSVAEAVANRVPTLFVPYPFHRDQHQRHNAEPVVAGGKGWIATDRIEPDRNLDSIGELLSSLLTDRGTLDEARRRLEANVPPDGAAAAAERMERLAGLSAASSG